jgi:hypothetical protein
MSPQDKIIHVANKLGLSTLKDMQGSTGAVYDVDTDFSGQIFSSASRHQNPSVTNLNDNSFEVNEALLIENISFYTYNTSTFQTLNFQQSYGSNAVIVYDLVIGNKRVMKNTPVFSPGCPYTFANVGQKIAPIVGIEPNFTALAIPRHQTFLEGAGILIPPQIEWSIDYRIFNMVTGAVITPNAGRAIGCYLFGTRVLLNFNTTI